ncbi:MAG: hypothetical protein QHH14_13065 [Clostridiales bacterium]|nr:hypothetical protein [Clostridiales bacterium]
MFRTRERTLFLRRIIRTTTVILISLLFCFLILEICLRILGQAPSNITEGVYEQDEGSYRLKKNIKKLTKWPSLNYITYTNQFGFRDKSIGGRQIKDKPYVIFLGTCETYGSGVNYEKTYVGIIDNLLNKNGIEVLNLAVPGHFLRDQERLLMNFLKTINRKPDKVLICVSQVTLAAFDKVISHTLVKNGYLFKKNSNIIPYIRVTLANNSASYCFFRDRIRQIIVRVFGQRARIANEFFDLFSKKGKLADPRTQELFFSYLEELDRKVEQEGIIPVYVYLPIIDTFNLEELLIKNGKDPLNFDISIYSDLLEAHCANNKVNFVNLQPILKDLHQQGKTLKIDFHPYFNENAHKIIADVIYKELMKNPS